MAQELKAHGYNLYYYDNKKIGEVDYLIEDADNLSNVPIEVKSGKDYAVHSALDKLLSVDEYGIKRAYVLSNEREVLTRNGITYIRLGTYPQERVEGEYAFSNDIRDTADGRITVKNGHGYKHSALKWIILDNNNKEAIAISEFVIDKLRKDEIAEYLSGFTERVMPDNSVADCIEKVTLPDLDVLVECADTIPDNDETDYCKAYPKNTIWAMYWGERQGRTVAYYKKNTPMVAQIANNVTCGIRPCITINIDKLLKKYQIT